MATVISAKKFIDFFEDDDIIAEMLQNNYQSEKIEEYDISDISDFSDNDEEDQKINKESLVSNSEESDDDIFITNDLLDGLDKEQLEDIEKIYWMD